MIRHLLPKKAITNASTNFSASFVKTEKITMKITSVFLLSLSLLAISPSAHSYWTDDYQIGDSYSGLLDIAPLGARKHVPLPPTEGRWVLVGMNDHSVMARSSGNSGGPISIAVARLVFAEVINGQVSAVLEANATHQANNVIFSDVKCDDSKKYLYRDDLPSIGRPLEKCLIVESVTTSALPDISPATPVTLQIKQDSMLVQATATIQGRDGFLEFKITPITNFSVSRTAFDNDFFKWMQRYAKVLAPSLSHTADHVVKSLTGVPRLLADGSITEYDERNGRKSDLSHDQILRSIEKLKEFKDKGILSEEEFKVKKEDLLKRL